MPQMWAAGAAATNTLVGGAIQANAQGNIAKAQEGAAQGQQAQAESYAAPTAAEISALGNQVQLYNQQYNQASVQLDQVEKQLTDTYGPNITQVGSQLLDSLKGKPSPMATSYLDQQKRARTQLENQLVSQLGPGALTSSVGLQALNNFDFNTSTNYASINATGINNSVNQLGALTGDQSSIIGNINNIYASLRAGNQSILSASNTLQVRQLNALLGTSAPVINSAGSQFVEEKGLGQAFAQSGQTFAQGLGGGGGGDSSSSGAGTASDGVDYSTKAIPSSDSYQMPVQGGQYGGGAQGLPSGGGGGGGLQMPTFGGGFGR